MINRVCADAGPTKNIETKMKRALLIDTPNRIFRFRQ
jgi:hypothetical protein